MLGENNEEAPREKKGRNGRVAIITAMFAGLAGVITAGGGVWKQHVEAKEARAATDVHVRRNYLTLREAVITDRSRINQLSSTIVELRAEIRVLRAEIGKPILAMAPAPLWLDLAEVGGDDDDGAGEARAPSRDKGLDELDVYELPDEVPFPSQEAIDHYIEAEERAAD